MTIPASDTAIAPEAPAATRPLAWATWSRALILIATILVIRIIYLAWFCPVQLIGDESYYWQQARHLDWCYDEKGPLLAWMMAPCLWLLGNTVLSVRLPMVIASAVAAWGVGKLALNVYNRDQRIAFFAVLTFCLIPAFQANAQICTQDGPLIVAWLALTAITLRLLRRWHANQNTWPDWMLFWITMGLGIDLKQSMPLFLACGAVYLILQRRHLRWRWGQLISQQLIGGILCLLIMSPMIIWNAFHHWPMLEHTLGHLGAGGDQAGHVDSGNALTWSGTLLAGFFGAMGPAFIALAMWSLIRTWHARSASNSLPRYSGGGLGWGPPSPALPRSTGGGKEYADELWLHCSAWPALGFFLLLSFTKPVIPSWPLPSFVALCVPIAALVVEKLPTYLEMMQTWRTRRASGEKIKKPDTALHRWWWTLCAYGIAGWLLLSFPTTLAHIPVVGPKFTRSLMDRITGHRAKALELSKTLAQLHRDQNLDPIVVTRHYMAAGLYSFYLPGNPTIRTAGKYLGKRATTYSQWPDTRMDNPALYGQTLLLDGLGDVPWDKALKFDKMTPLPGGKFFLATNYRGPQPNHPQFVKGLDR